MPRTKIQAPEMLAQQKTTSLSKLQELACPYAEEVLLNPVFKEPKAQSSAWKELWNSARNNLAMQAIRGAIEIGEASVLQLWACECVEEGLPLYERHYQDSRLREALQITRAYVEGKAATGERRGPRSHRKIQSVQRCEH